MADGKALIFIPTYNEAENVEIIFRQIRELKLTADILFLDDNSPDGTGKIVDRLKDTNDGVYTIHRTGKQGIGSAHQEGIRWAYEHHYQVLITMDCDFSHSPKYLLNFMEYRNDADIVVGSRYLEKESLKEWNWYRKVLTHLGHFLTHKLLKMPYDATGAFRLYRLDRIPQSAFKLVRSSGYSFFFESLYILQLNAHSLKEFSIRLPTRTYGHSKMSLNMIFKSLFHLISIYRRTVFDRKSFLYKRG